MSRFKEQRRIDEAIKHKNLSELSWALDYCKHRNKLATMKEHMKHWHKLIASINKTIESIENNKNNT